MKHSEGELIGSGVHEIMEVDAIVEEIDRRRIDPSEFRGTGLFDDGEIDADLEVCRRLEGKFEEQNRKHGESAKSQTERGLLGEYTFRHALEEYGWLTEEVQLIIASKYDDYVRGIDSVAEIASEKEGPDHIGFAIDFATSSEDVGSKLRKTFDSLDLGYTPSVKYFTSPSLGKQKNFKVPRIVIGVGTESLQRLAAYSSEIMHGSEMAKEAKEQIRRDTFRFVVIGEIVGQLSVFYNRLQKVISQAQTEQRPEIVKRATVPLKIHERALNTMMKIVTAHYTDMNEIQRHVRGDTFAAKMGSALSLLSMTPIDFSQEQKRTSGRRP